MKKSVLSICFVLMAASLAYGGQQNRIELKNGSTVEGEIVGFSEGKYTVKSPSFGTFEIEASKILTIRNEDPAGGSLGSESAPLSALDIQNEIQKRRPELAGNPDIMKMVPGLISNPEFQDLLKDPELVNAAKSRDIKALMANPKFVRAINDPAVQEIRKKIKEQ